MIVTAGYLILAYMPDQISQADVKKMAELARLGLSSQELKQATKDLQSIFEHFAIIQQIDTNGVPTTDDITGLKNVVRTDQAQPEVLSQTDELLEAMPETKDRQLKVKKIFE